jgi:hypothetical protein
MVIFLKDNFPISFILLEKEELINSEIKEDEIDLLSFIYCPTMEEPCIGGGSCKTKRIFFILLPILFIYFNNMINKCIVLFTFSYHFL